MDFNLTLIGQTIAMIVFVWFSMKFIWPVLMNVIEKRRKEIADGIAAGEKGQKELAEARQGSEAILAGRAPEGRPGRGHRPQALERAGGRGQEPGGHRERAHRDGRRAARPRTRRHRARDALRKEVAALALAGARQVLGREVDAKAHAQLLDELAAELEKQAPARG